MRATDQGLADIVEANVIDGCAGWAASAEAELHRTDELTWIVSTVPSPLLNVVLRARLPVDGIEARLAAAAALYRERDLPFAWWVGPSSRPAGLGARLESIGLMHAGTLVGMTADLGGLRTGVRDPAGLTIEEVTDEAGLARWCGLLGEVHGQTELAEGPFRRFHGQEHEHEHEREGFRPRWRLFLGSLRGRAVATCALLQGRAAAAVADLSTRREACGRGVASALSLYALLQARTAGYELATACASPAAEPLLRRLGFSARGELRLYISDAPDR